MHWPKPPWRPSPWASWSCKICVQWAPRGLPFLNFLLTFCACVLSCPVGRGIRLPTFVTVHLQQVLRASVRLCQCVCMCGSSKGAFRVVTIVFVCPLTPSLLVY